MKVQMLVSTGIMNGYAHAGDVLEVDENTAERWFQYKIAKVAEVKTSPKVEVPTSEQPEVKNDGVLEVMPSGFEDVKASVVPEPKKAGRPRKDKK